LSHSGPILQYLLGLWPTGNQVAGATPPIGVDFLLNSIQLAS
jgi:hypothetical protein